MPNPDNALGYADLTPQEVLDALDAVGLRGDGRILQLNSYENRVFQIFLEDGRAVVAKFYRPGRWSDAQIVEEHEFALELAEAEVSVVPPLLLEAVDSSVRLEGEHHTLACLQGHRFSVAARCAGREPELDHPDTLERIGSFIGRLHAVGVRRPFEHRHRMDPRRDGAWSMQTVQQSGLLTHAEAPAWQATAAHCLTAIAEAFDRAGPRRLLRLHGDCHIGNVLWRDDRPNAVDLDDAMQGPAVQDLWMLVSGDRQTLQQQLGRILSGYEQFMDFDPVEISLIEPLRTMRMLRHSAWLAERWKDPTFPVNFPFFGTEAYWSQQTTQLREQLESMADERAS